MHNATDPSKSWSPMHALDVGRWSDGSLAVCGTLPRLDPPPQNFGRPLAPRRIYKYVEGAQWSQFLQGIPPDASTTKMMMELERFNKARGKCVSVGEDGTVVGVMGDRAFRCHDGGPWTELPHTGPPTMPAVGPGRWVDISVVNKEEMWAVDWTYGIFSTLVPK
jgi:hypothetical protein